MNTEAMFQVSQVPTAELVCAWCGKQAVTKVETEPAKYRTVRKPVYDEASRREYMASVRVIAKAAITVPVCREHERMVERAHAEREREKERERAFKAARGMK